MGPSEWPAVQAHSKFTNTVTIQSPACSIMPLNGKQRLATEADICCRDGFLIEGRGKAETGAPPSQLTEMAEPSAKSEVPVRAV